MSLILVCVLFVIGLGISFREIYYKKTSIILNLSFICLFVFICGTRVGRSYSYSDLTAYLKYIGSGFYTYFDRGFVIYCEAIKKIVGSSGKLFIYAHSLIIICILLITIKVLSKQRNKKKEIGCIDEVERKKTTYYYGAIAFAFCMYWGFSFAAEGLRPGLCNSLILLSFACMIKGQVFFSLFVFCLAFSVHAQAGIFLPALLIARFKKKNTSLKAYLIWFLLLPIIDISVFFLGLSNVEMMGQCVKYLSNASPVFSFLTRFFVYESGLPGKYFSTQYITYHCLALVMLFGNLGNELYNKSVLIYYIGLSLGTFLQGTIIFFRIQTVYLIIVNIVIYFFITDNGKINRSIKYSGLVGYSLLQMIMMLRWLGYYIV